MRYYKEISYNIYKNAGAEKELVKKKLDGIFEVKYDYFYFSPFDMGSESSSYEVIGNIYDNPELLKKNEKNQ